MPASILLDLAVNKTTWLSAARKSNRVGSCGVRQGEAISDLESAIEQTMLVWQLTG